MINDVLIYSLCGASAATAVVSPLINILFRRPRRAEGRESGRPSFSVIITAHENARELESHLPVYLSQQYEGCFEIIVVDSKSDDRTEEVLARHKGNEHLYTTFIPSTSRYMSRKKLAMTIGAKAAKYEWLIFTDAECYPNSSRWLEAIAKNITSHSEIAVMYGNYAGETPSFRRYIQLTSSMYALRKALKGRAHMSASDCIAIKRFTFMQDKGFEGNLMYVRGEYDYIINKFARKRNTAVITAEEGWLKKDEPTRKSWKNACLFRIDTMRHLRHRKAYGIPMAADTISVHLSYIALITCITFAIIVNSILLTAVSALSLITCAAIRLYIASKTFKMYGEHIPLWKVLFFEPLRLLHSIKFKIKYRFSDKLDFISHKL